MRASKRSAVLVLITTGALVLAGCGKGASSGGDSGQNADAKSFELTVAANAIAGGKNDVEAKWMTDYVIPKFVAMEKKKGVDAKVTFRPSGVDDEVYKTKLSLDLKSGSGADIVSIDGIWTGEFAQAGYIKPLDEVVGSAADSWPGWNQIGQTVQSNLTFNGKRYGIPAGTDGRVLFYNKKLFAQAGLPTTWQPKSWQDVLDAGKKLKSIDGVVPLQINAGTAMGEATTMQGFLPLLQGTGTSVYEKGKWLGDGKPMKDVLGFYQAIYGGGLGDPQLQEEAKGRDKSFAEFSQNKIGVLLEGDYFWRSVLDPKIGINKMANRNSDVGWAFIPAQTPGSGVNGQAFVSMSGGGGRVINPGTEFPKQAWELLTFMNSKAATQALASKDARISARDDVNAVVLKGDPLLTFIADKVLPITSVRPPLAVYPQVSIALQQATADVVSGKSPEQAASTYAAAAGKAVGGADKLAH